MPAEDSARPASPPPPSQTRPPLGMDVLYRDDALLIVTKPAGLAVHRGWARDDVVLADLARDLVGHPIHLVHRLDRGTSGVLAVALTPAVARAMQAQWTVSEVDKRYLCLVRGTPQDRFVVDNPVPSPKAQKGRGGPRVPAVTDFRRLWAVRLPEHTYSWVEARPKTGRLHQIRRHLKHASHPIIGDVRYGKGAHNRLFRQRFGLHRLALHASELWARHPVTGARLHLRAPLPEDLAGPLRALGMPEELLEAGG